MTAWMARPDALDLIRLRCCWCAAGIYCGAGSLTSEMQVQLCCASAHSMNAQRSNGSWRAKEDHVQCGVSGRVGVRMIMWSMLVSVAMSFMHTKWPSWLYKSRFLPLRGQMKQGFFISKGEARREKHEKWSNLSLRLTEGSTSRCWKESIDITTIEIARINLKL